MCGQLGLRNCTPPPTPRPPASLPPSKITSQPLRGPAAPKHNAQHSAFCDCNSQRRGAITAQQSRFEQTVLRGLKVNGRRGCKDMCTNTHRHKPAHTRRFYQERGRKVLRCARRPSVKTPIRRSGGPGLSPLKGAFHWPRQQDCWNAATRSSHSAWG